jgi:KaiC/GvpD/RAD55 family RecA-like ATPase
VIWPVQYVYGVADSRKSRLKIHFAHQGVVARVAFVFYPENPVRPVKQARSGFGAALVQGAHELV